MTRTRPQVWAPIPQTDLTYPPAPYPVIPEDQLLFILEIWCASAPDEAATWQPASSIHERLHTTAANNRFVFPWSTTQGLFHTLKGRIPWLEQHNGLQRQRDFQTGKMLYRFQRSGDTRPEEKE
jgi:hypothetical protein